MKRNETAARLELKHLRETLGLDPSQLSHLLYDSTAAYYDLEECDGELTTNVDLGELSNICRALGTTPRKLFDPGSITRPMPPSALISKVNDHIRQADISLNAFEEKVGYEISDALHDPTKVTAWNLDLLQAICAQIGVDWVEALPE